MATLERLLVDRNQLHNLGVTLSLAEIDRRERKGEWPRRIKAGRHRNSRVFYRYDEIMALVEKWATETPPLQDDDLRRAGRLGGAHFESPFFMEGAMHVTIEHLDHITFTYKKWFQTKTGVDKANFVKILIELTEIERAILDERQLWSALIHEIPNPNYEYQFQQYRVQCDDFALEQKMRPLLTAFSSYPQEPNRTLRTTIADLCTPDRKLSRFSTIGEAKNFALEARTYIQKLNNYRLAPVGSCS